MSLIAMVCNEQLEPITNPIIVLDDDFTTVENRANVIRVAGGKCCIRWSRATDGCVGFWGPDGECVQPFWYGG